MSLRSCVLFSFLLFLISKAPALSFEENDMVVLVGNTFVERAQKYGYFEAGLTRSTDQKGVKFRNLGWSGDTVYGDARSYFGPPREGFDRLRANLKELKPQVVILCYGAVAAFEGESGEELFVKGYERLVKMISEVGVREIVLVSPPPAESLGGRLPKMEGQNARLARYRDLIKGVAERQKCGFADLFGAMEGKEGNWTENGLHFGAEGYEKITPLFLTSLGLKPSSANGALDQKIREEIVAKNKLFFFKWRPANETYLRLFRKHEQGQNAKELELFDPLIEEAEKRIENLRIELKGGKR